jgi:DNA helicase HerA-like ATPase
MLPSIESILKLDIGERDRPVRKIQYYWAILAKGGFKADEGRLRQVGLAGANARDFNPHFSQGLRDAAYKYAAATVPPHPTTLRQLIDELEVVATFAQDNAKDKALRSTGSGDPIFDPQDLALLRFLAGSGAGPAMLQPYTRFHASDASDFTAEILALLDVGKTVILDLGNATDEFRRYFADMLSRAVFAHQETKFVDNKLGSHFVQLYFEEAHNLFPVDDKDLTGVYARFAKEGAKFHIGMVYSTQSPSTINRELLVQTENFFVGHLASQDETKALTRVQIAFAGIEQDILRAKTPGYMRMLTLSHRFVVPMQANRFEAGATSGGAAAYT